jgi:hypothetical protein
VWGWIFGNAFLENDHNLNQLHKMPFCVVAKAMSSLHHVLTTALWFSADIQSS